MAFLLQGGMKQEKQILLVEDDVSINHLTTRILERAGYAVVAFTEPVPALEHFLSCNGAFSAAITDLTMIEMSGTELAEKIWARRPTFPIILSSGYVGPEAEEDAKKAGFFALLEKPFSAEHLVDLVGRAALA
jgi:DNA-binding NtrC family response regulator